MTKEGMAKLLHGREYGKEITEAEEMLARENNLCITYGYSDDAVELRGIWDDEIYAFNPKKIFVDKSGEIKNECDSDDCPYFTKIMESATYFIHAKKDVEDYLWWFETNLPFAPFDVMEDGEKFCRGIVIDTSSITTTEGR